MYSIFTPISAFLVIAVWRVCGASWPCSSWPGQGLGVFMFTMLPTLRLGLSFASLWGVISFSISGMSFPVMAMHPVLQGVANLFPLRHYFLLYVNSALDGYPLANAWPFVLALMGFALLPWPCMLRLKKVLTTYRYEP